MELSKYLGLTWDPDPMGQNRLIGSSEFTVLKYVIDFSIENKCVLYAVFSDDIIIDLEDPEVPHSKLGNFADLDAACLVAERHDYSYAHHSLSASGQDPVFIGSDRVKEIREVLSKADIEPDEFIPGDFICPNGVPFNKAASFFHSTKQALKQNADGMFSVTFSIPPEDIPMWLSEAPYGTKMIFGAVQNGHEEKPDQRTWNKTVEAAIKQAHILLSDGTFQEWLGTKYDRYYMIADAMQSDSDAVHEAVETTFKRLIGIPSFKDLKTDVAAFNRFERYHREFYKDCSLGFGQHRNHIAA